jgi:phosphoribosylglycinamide formyltransferase-1
VTNLGLFASHRGSNAQAILDACASGRLAARVALLLSNNSGSGAAQRARQAGVPFRHLSGATHPDPDALDRAVLEALRVHGVELVVLAGYMKKIGPRTLAAYRGRILNTHPALLPRFGGAGMYGMRVHEAVLAAGERETGVTVHVVDAGYDTGPIVAQCRVPVLADDTPASLAERVVEREREFLVETLRAVLDKQIALPEP